MPPMSGPLDDASRPPDPGDRPPAGRLAHAPSERYAERLGSRVPGGADGTPRQTSVATLLGALVPAIVALLVTVAAMVVVGGVLAEQRGLLLTAGFGGAAIGLLAAGAAVSPDGVAPPALPRGRAVRVAVFLAVLAVAGAAIGTWAYGRLEGGVLDPVTYLWTVFGPLIPAEAVLAGLTAAWGAGAGPVRSRS
ncbi:MAG: hypothetical protein A2V84_01825 [Chloroflexi bacterium RBG_16_70_13]|nr:MAG: hypothetical protein A2V84_01825 [Chloroflexi bacterium RBG_16_70_13]